MAAKIFHVYPFHAAWAVKKDGKLPETFPTQREAVAMAVQRVKNANAAVIIVHAKDGRVVDRRSYGVPKIPKLPKMSPLAKQIEKAVGKVVLDQLISESTPRRAHAPAK